MGAHHERLSLLRCKAREARPSVSPLSPSTQRQLQHAQRRWGKQLQLREGGEGRELRLQLSDEGVLAALLQFISELPESKG